MISLCGIRPVRAVLVGVCAFTASLSLAQTPGHLSVSPGTYHPLAGANTTLTGAMCRPADTACKQNVGKPLFGDVTQTATDEAGDIYAADSGHGIIVKIRPNGTPLIVGGTYQTNSSMTFNGLSVDVEGNVYYSVTGVGVFKLDVLGGGGYLPTGSIAPAGMATDVKNNVFFAEQNKCTIDEYVAATNRVHVVAGNAAAGCGSSAPATSGTAAGTQLSTPVGVAVGSTGTVYFTDAQGDIYSVTTDGMIHVLALSSSGAPTSGPLGSGGNIGMASALEIDAAGNLYFRSNSNVLVELTAGTPQEVIVLSGNYSEGTTAEGSPATLAGLPLTGNNFALDRFGRMAFGTGGATSDAVFVIDKNGSLIFDNPQAYSQQTLTYTNSGGSTLHGLSFGGTGYPYLIGPTDADIKANGETGNQPFSVFQYNGQPPADSCLNKFATGSFTLAAGDSCTIVIEYGPNNNVPPAGVITFFTDDPNGPVSTSLLATYVSGSTAPASASERVWNANFSRSTGVTGFSKAVSKASVAQGNGAPTYNVSAVNVKLSQTDSKAGNFTFNVSVVSTTSGATPSGTIVLGLVNSGTNVHSPVQQAILDGSGNATFSFTGVPLETYAVYAVYEGDGTSNPAYSPAQEVVAGVQGDYAAFAVGADLLYEGATAQYLNFTGIAVSSPHFAVAQDFLSGATALSFTLTDPNGNVVDTTSTAILPVGKYKITPSVTNAQALGYAEQDYSNNLNLQPYPLQVYEGPAYAFYGQYLTTGAADSGHYTLAGHQTIGDDRAFVDTDLASGAISIGYQFVGAPSDPTTTYLPVGHYEIMPTLSGPGASNYVLQPKDGFVAIQKAFLNLRPGNLRLKANTTYTASQLCQAGACNTYPNAALLTTDPGLTVALQVTGSGYDGPAISYPNGTISLAAGTYTVTPLVSGSAASNYGARLQTGTLKVQ